MKKLFLGLLIMLSSLLVSSQTNKIVVEKMNPVVYGDIRSSTFVYFDTFVTRETLYGEAYKYRYEIKIYSQSKLNNLPTTLYITGVHIFANGGNISQYQHPAGFWVLIPSKKEFVLYWYKTNNPQINFSYSWSNITFY